MFGGILNIDMTVSPEEKTEQMKQAQMMGMTGTYSISFSDGNIIDTNVGVIQEGVLVIENTYMLDPAQNYFFVGVVRGFSGESPFVLPETKLLLAENLPIAEQMAISIGESVQEEIIPIMKEEKKEIEIGSNSTTRKEISSAPRELAQTGPVSILQQIWS